MSGILADLVEDEVVIDLANGEAPPITGIIEDQAVPTPEDKELTLTIQVEDLKATMDAVTIKGKEEFEAACEWLKAVKKKTKEVEAFYEPDKKKFYGIYKDIMAKTKKLTDVLKVCETGVKSKIKEYTDEQERIEREKQRKAEEERQKAIEAQKEECGDDTQELGFTDPLANVGPAPVIPAKKVGKNSAGVVVAKVWDWEIEDITKIPQKYFVLDEKKINGVVKSLKGEHGIPGIKAFEKNQVRG